MCCVELGRLVQVQCGYVPSRQAHLPAGQSRSPGYAPPSGWTDRDDPRPWPRCSGRRQAVEKELL